MKDKLEMTEMRKQANRMNFAEIEEDAYQEDLGFSLGQIGKGGTGRVRAAQVDNKTQVKISKSLQVSPEVDREVSVDIFIVYNFNQYNTILIFIGHFRYQ